MLCEGWICAGSYKPVKSQESSSSVKALLSNRHMSCKVATLLKPEIGLGPKAWFAKWEKSCRTPFWTSTGCTKPRAACKGTPLQPGNGAPTCKCKITKFTSIFSGIVNTGSCILAYFLDQREVKVTALHSCAVQLPWQTPRLTLHFWALQVLLYSDMYSIARAQTQRKKSIIQSFLTQSYQHFSRSLIKTTKIQHGTSVKHLRGSSRDLPGDSSPAAAWLLAAGWKSGAEHEIQALLNFRWVFEKDICRVKWRQEIYFHLSKWSLKKTTKSTTRFYRWQTVAVLLATVYWLALLSKEQKQITSALEFTDDLLNGKHITCIPLLFSFMVCLIATLKTKRLSQNTPNIQHCWVLACQVVYYIKELCHLCKNQKVFWDYNEYKWCFCDYHNPETI